jgi:3-hydroxybutyryl-CoA dehydrogenase
VPGVGIEVDATTELDGDTGAAGALVGGTIVGSGAVDGVVSPSPVHEPATTVAPSARNVRRDSCTRAVSHPGRDRPHRARTGPAGTLQPVTQQLERIGVIGCGLMGSGIAEVCARAGMDVIVREVTPEAAEAGRARLTRSLDRGVRSGKLSEADRDAAVNRLGFTTDLSDLADRQLLVEAVVEDEDLKVDVFRTLDKVVTADDAILASNTSSIPIMKLGIATGRPEQVIGIHFFNPVPVLGLVELVTSLLTSPETASRADAFAGGQLGKHVIRSQDRAGFIVNALLIPYILSAIRMMESGFATAEDIDTGMVEGCNHPMGPLHLADLIGLDTTQAVALSLYEEFKEPLYAPSPMLSRMVEAGLLGRKTGRGFFEYAER